MTSERNQERSCTNQKKKKIKKRFHWNGIPDYLKYRRKKFNQAMEERHNAIADDSMITGIE